MPSPDKPSQLTPMLRQYHEIKKQHPGTLLFFRLGDFYELFFDDALIGSREMEITLTARHKERGNPVPICGSGAGMGMSVLDVSTGEFFATQFQGESASQTPQNYTLALPPPQPPPP